MKDKTTLKNALKKARATQWEQRAALILFAINGIDNAIAYADGLRIPRQQKLFGHGLGGNGHAMD